jgi:MFS family permease
MITRLKTFTKSFSSSGRFSSGRYSSFGEEEENEITPILGGNGSPSSECYDSITRKGHAVEYEEEGEEEELLTFAGLTREVLESGAYRMIPLLLIIGIAFSMIVPSLPNTCTDYFASSTSGKELKCQDFPLEAPPPPCLNAHWQCIQYQSIWLLVSNSVFSFLLNPVIGKLSDEHGRKGFLVLGTAFSCLPVYAFYMLAHGYGNYRVAYPFLSLGMAFGPLSTALAYVSDLVVKKYRTQALGMLLGEMFCGIIIGPPLSKLFEDSKTNAMLACVFATIALAYSMTIPESLHVSRRRTLNKNRHNHNPTRAVKKGNDARTRGRGRGVQRSCLCSRKVHLKQIATLGRSRFFILMSLIAMIGSLASEGTMETSAQYFQLVSGFTTADQANLITVIGVSGLFIQFVVLPYLLSVIKRREKYLIACTNMFLCLINLGIAFFAKNKTLAITLQALSYLGILSFTVSAGLLSKAVNEKHQGLVTGVISGLRAQAMGIGPMLYSMIFKLFTKTNTAQDQDGSSSSSSSLPYLPGACFIFTAILMLVSSILALLLDTEATIDIIDDEEDEEDV